ncbi:MAG: hypothetical protein PWQ51_2649 [Methanolobus sp.]|jgi:hypothetical protein|uniref:hypothetical protein n=1 Tax=unclassified Methanolobus TaxID=2629569 RepID=UPI00324694AB|nr:hypothetical protein [Methanolobus sp.]
METTRIDLANHMKDFGLGLLSHSMDHAVFANPVNSYWNAFGVLHAAQASEIIIKSCIAIEHPLLIFTKVPKLKDLKSGALSIESLLNNGKTYQYSDLPDLLWATTGYTIKNLDFYYDFGKLRNTIQHLAVPDIDLSEETFKFVFYVIEPLIEHFWKTNVFLNLEEDVTAEYLIEALIDRNIEINGWIPEMKAGKMYYEPWINTKTKKRIWSYHNSNVLLDCEMEYFEKLGTIPEDHNFKTWEDLYSDSSEM